MRAVKLCTYKLYIIHRILSFKRYYIIVCLFFPVKKNSPSAIVN